jgi:ubiquinone biosynthesis protein COQ9
MNQDILREQRDGVLRALLARSQQIETSAFVWNWPDVVAVQGGGDHADIKARALFPEGLVSVLDHYADWMDRQMLHDVSDIPPSGMTARIRHAVLARLQILQTYRAAERAALAFWALPSRKPRAMRVLWRTADRIWTWAGDTSTDYNHYTKRGLLAGVIATTLLAWSADDSPDLRTTHDFLDRRLQNVLTLGKWVGQFKSRAA